MTHVLAVCGDGGQDLGHGTLDKHALDGAEAAARPVNCLERILNDADVKDQWKRVEIYCKSIGFDVSCRMLARDDHLSKISSKNIC